MKCWGYNAYGQLGDNSTTNSLTPVTVFGMTKGAKAVSASYFHTCAISSKGAAQCWGYNGTGQLGDNSTTNSLKPVGVYNLDKSTKLTVGSEHSCVVTAKKAVKCWGSNTVGQIGDNTTTTTLQPVKVFGY